MRGPESAQVSNNKFKVTTKQQLQLISEEKLKIKTLNNLIKSPSKFGHTDRNPANIFSLQVRASEQFHTLPSQKSTINNKQNEIDILKYKSKFQENLAKITSNQELKLQIQNSFEQIIEQMLNEASNNQSQDLLSKIKGLKQEINDKNIDNEGLQKEIQKLQQQVKQQSEQLQQNSNQIQQFQTPKQYQKEKTQQSLHKIVIKEIQGEGETVENLLHSITEKDNKIEELQVNLADHNAIINQLRQKIKQQDLLIQSQQDIIQNKQQEVQNLENKLLALQSSQKQQKKTIQQDKGIQIQNNSKQTIEEIKAILSFRLKRSMIEQKEILNYLLANEDYRFFSIQSRFEKFPFLLNAEQSYNITMFLLTEESPYNQKVLEKDLKLTVLKSRILHLLPQYELLTIDEQGQLFQYISTKIIDKLNYLQDRIKQIKKSQKSDIEERFCLPEQLIEAFECILDNSLSKKEGEYIFQLNFEISNSPILINISRLIQLFQIKPKYGINKVCNLSDSFFKEKELTNIKGPSLIRNQSAVLNLSSKQMNIQAHKFQQTDDTELGNDKKQKTLEFHRIIQLNLAPTFDKVEVGVCCQKELVIVQQNELSYNYKKVRIDQENLEKVKQKQYLQQQYLQQQQQLEKQKEDLQKAKSNKNKEIKNIVSLYMDQLLEDFINSSGQD